MYGLLLEAIKEYITEQYGEAKWVEICTVAKIDYKCFSIHTSYPENLIPSIGDAASSVLGQSGDEMMENFGGYFVGYVGQYGYDRVLKVSDDDGGGGGWCWCW
jgi:guanylate cyclase